MQLFRIGIAGEAIHLRFDQTGELRTGDGFVRLEPLVLQVAVEPDRFRFAQRAAAAQQRSGPQRPQTRDLTRHFRTND